MEERLALPAAPVTHFPRLTEARKCPALSNQLRAGLDRRLTRGRGSRRLPPKLDVEGLLGRPSVDADLYVVSGLLPGNQLAQPVERVDALAVDGDDDVAADPVALAGEDDVRVARPDAGLRGAAVRDDLLHEEPPTDGQAHETGEARADRLHLDAKECMLGLAALDQLS